MSLASLALALLCPVLAAQDDPPPVDSGLTVVDGEASPLEGVEVFCGSLHYVLALLGYVGDPSEDSYCEAVTDGNGRFLIASSVADAGIAQVELTLAGHRQMRSASGDLFASGSQLVMLPASPLEVLVVEADGKPVPRASVLVEVRNGMHFAMERGATGDDGIAELGLFPGGDFVLTVERPSNRPDLAAQVITKLALERGARPTVQLGFADAERGRWTCEARSAAGDLVPAIVDAKLTWLGGDTTWRSSLVALEVEGSSLQSELVDGQPYELRLEAEGFAPFRRIFRFDLEQAGTPFVAQLQRPGAMTLEFLSGNRESEAGGTLLVQHYRRQHRLDHWGGSEAPLPIHWTLEANEDLLRNQEMDELLARKQVELVDLQPGTWRIALSPFQRALQEGWVPDPQLVTVPAGGHARATVRIVPGVLLRAKFERPAGSKATPIVDVIDDQGRVVTQNMSGAFGRMTGADELPIIGERLLPGVYTLRTRWWDETAEPPIWSTEVVVDARRKVPEQVRLPFR
ncbi:hypothetical protein [Engelhardtia mirabilis]|uniref:Nickel uptake substrate-specific transmembrane region n=1 Tax=Engelhardtia mirabilis TaxID=2528011 RepID=A0A518BPT4_9BACT|nr:hypothetical protein Pla133_41030 [Planctomycetes bacterium Pla133]QDV03315.1 hypothetical protein Pla86_41020 [Planctomycetes bacterium Pla86]